MSWCPRGGGHRHDRVRARAGAQLDQAAELGCRARLEGEAREVPRQNDRDVAVDGRDRRRACRAHYGQDQNQGSDRSRPFPVGAHSAQSPWGW